MFVSITEDNTTVMVSILQKCRREKENENVFIGFEVIARFFQIHYYSLNILARPIKL